MDVAFYLGAFAIHWYGILIALAVIAAIGITIVEAKRRGQHAEQVSNLAPIVIPLGMIGARLYHVIDKWEYYIHNPALIIGGHGLGIFGAVIGGGIGLIVYTMWRKLSPLRWLDIIAPGLLYTYDTGAEVPKPANGRRHLLTICHLLFCGTILS
jgi:phosphatidylglycerol---prolipoprotein diacylglyceryl transferase